MWPSPTEPMKRHDRASPLSSDTPAATAAVDRLGLSAAWRALGGPMASVISLFLDDDLVQVLVDAPVPDPDSTVADVVLVDTVRSVTVSLMVMVDRASLRGFATRVFGAAGHDDEHGAALVLETANLVMGVAQSALVVEGYLLTASTPREISFAEAGYALGAARVRRRFTFACGGGHLHVLVRAAVTSQTMVPGRLLREGMVLVDDLHDRVSGERLAEAGTRLTQTGAQRLRRIAPFAQVLVRVPGSEATEGSDA